MYLYCKKTKTKFTECHFLRLNLKYNILCVACGQFLAFRHLFAACSVTYVCSYFLQCPDVAEAVLCDSRTAQNCLVQKFLDSFSSPSTVAPAALREEEFLHAIQSSTYISHSHRGSVCDAKRFLRDKGEFILLV